jgi:hypothetical protein
VEIKISTFFRLGVEDSNLGIRSQSPLSYH